MRSVLLATALLLATSPSFAGKEDRASAPAPAPAPAETVALPCDYTPGAVHRYRVEKRTLRREPGQPVSAQGNSATITLTVVAHDGAKTLLDAAWSDHAMASPPQDEAMATMLRRLAEVSAGVPVRVEVDHGTSTPRVVDSSALLAAYRSLAGDVKAAVAAQQPDVPQEALDAIDEALANKDLAEASLIEDLSPLFGFTCGAVPVGEARYEAALPNPFGREPLPATGTLGGVVGADVVTFAVHERLDPVRVMDQLGPIIEQLGVKLPKDAGLEDLQVELGTDVEVVVDRATGWVRSWSSARVGSALGGERTDTVTGTRLP